jgi:hypothetical protein
MKDFDKKKEIDHLFDAIRKGSVSSFKETSTPNVKYGSYHAVLQKNNAEYDYSYSDYRETVCVPFPNNDRMWLAEIKRLGKSSDKDRIFEAYRVVSKSIPWVTTSSLKGSGVLDINFDGINDYLSNELIIFSRSDSFQSIEKLGNGIEHGEFFIFGVKSSGKICHINDYKSFFVTTDGDSYFLNNQCDLTKLSK